VTTYAVRPFRAADVEAMELLEEIRALLKEAGILETAGETFARSGPAFTALADGVLLGSAGLILHWKGVAEVWLLPTPYIADHPLFVFRSFRRCLWEMIRLHRLRRVQALVSADVPINHRWVERLGFTLEGAMPRYGPFGETHLRYALLPEVF